MIGLLGGVLSGMFGVGGGILMIPLLIWFAGMDQRSAAATSLAAIVPTSVAGAVGYLARGEADLVVAALVAAGGIAGSMVGSRLLRRVHLTALRWMFIALMLLVAIRMLTALPVRGQAVELDVTAVLALVGIGLLMGVTAGLFGIGGGLIVVPALVLLLGMGDLLAKGTSLLVMAPTAATGTWANARAGLVDLPAGLVVGLAATAASFVGVALAFWIPPRPAAVMFAVLVLASAAQLAWRAARGR